VKYQPPFDPGFGGPVNGIYNPDANAAYVNGNPATGQEGSIPPMEALDHPMRELVHLIVSAGLTPSHSDLEQVRKAIKKMIEAAIVSNAVTGGAIPLWEGLEAVTGFHKIRPLVPGSNIAIDLVEEPAGSGRYQVRVGTVPGLGRLLPIFPEISETDGLLTISNLGGGTLEISSGQSFVWRGWRRILTSDFLVANRRATTVANKTYHWVWYAPGHANAPELTWPNGRFMLRDLADVAYNPTSAAEENSGFDATFDTMLFARVVTNSANVATILPLANRATLWGELTGSPRSLSPFPGGASPSFVHAFPLAWGRTPKLHLRAMSPPGNVNDSDYLVVPQIVTRSNIEILSSSWHFSGTTTYNGQSPGFTYGLTA